MDLRDEYLEELAVLLDEKGGEALRAVLTQNIRHIFEGQGNGAGNIGGKISVLENSIDSMFNEFEQSLDDYIRETVAKSYAETISEIAGLRDELHPADDDISRMLNKYLESDIIDYEQVLAESRAEITDSAKREFKKSLSQYQSLPQTTESIQEFLEELKRDSVGIVDFETWNGTLAGKVLGFERLGIDSYRIIDEDDGKSCRKCSSLGDKVFDITEYMPGETAPPFHRNCRCTIVPVMAENFKLPDELSELFDEQEDYTQIKQRLSAALNDKNEGIYAKHGINEDVLSLVEKAVRENGGKLDLYSLSASTDPDDKLLYDGLKALLQIQTAKFPNDFADNLRASASSKGINDPMILDEKVLKLLRQNSANRQKSYDSGGIYKWQEENIAVGTAFADLMFGLAGLSVVNGGISKGNGAADNADFVEAEIGAGNRAIRKIPSKNVSDLPSNAQNSYSQYDKSGWKGNFAGQNAGTKAGGAYQNSNGTLPTKDSVGNPITYREFDVTNKLPGVGRDAQRFLLGSDGSIYYTDSHYGDIISPTGLPVFIKLK